MLRRIQLDAILKDWSGLEASWTSWVALVVENPPADAGDERDTDLSPEPDRFPGGGHGNTFQYSCLENPWTEEPVGLQSIRVQRLGHN